MRRDLITPDPVDFMAASTIPLFHAAESHHALLGRHLFEMERDPSSRQLAIDYRNACQRFFDLLTDPTEHRVRSREASQKHKALLLKELEQDKALYTQLTEEHKKELLNISAALEISGIMKTKPNLSTKQQQLWKNHQFLFQQIETSSDQVEALTLAIDDLTNKIDHPNRKGEVALFFKENRLFTTNFGGGHEQLTKYFVENPFVRDFFLEADNQAVFHEVASSFISRVIKANYSLKGHPLPSYLCPFQADDPRFCYTIDDKRFRHYDKVYKTTKFFHLKTLRSRLTEIQTLLLDSHKENIAAAKGGIFTPPTSTINSSNATNELTCSIKQADPLFEQ